MNHRPNPDPPRPLPPKLTSQPTTYDATPKWREKPQPSFDVLQESGLSHREAFYWGFVAGALITFVALMIVQATVL